MVQDRRTGRFVYTERLERRAGETPWEYVRRSVRREGQIRRYYTGDRLRFLVGWGVESVEDFLESYPEYRGPSEYARDEGRPSEVTRERMDPAG
ncbi:hypothetical protein SAMN00767673_0458 [Rubrobacter radiotolerans DSM 5868]|nr:hypothetical protein SAMN00767673_0458 [Rubrobacter radiotolerans DSM 5868]